MNNNHKTLKTLIISIIGLFMVIYTSSMEGSSGLETFLPIPFALIATLTDNKFTILYTIIAFVASILMNNMEATVNIFITLIIPALTIGIALRKRVFEEVDNRFESIYYGIIVNMLSTIVIYVVYKEFFNIDLLVQFKEMMSVIVEQQQKIIEQNGMELSIDFDDMLLYVSNIIPAMVFLQSVIMTFLVYIVEMITLNIMKIRNTRMSVLSEFYLPGNIVVSSLIIYVLVALLLNGLKVELILSNTQVVFYSMFMMQGLSVCIYYFKKWTKLRNIKSILIYGALMSIFGALALSFIGMLDTMNDFRKVRKYKPV